MKMLNLLSYSFC